ncbi:unnamed protein product [Pseudo-nitzschia multistriata]|uniref:Nuclear segregation protein Bfr1 n=1 Tax=Pseudo-nitzschia multistriata TaxID=183589 RepID=A0A448YV03_9STRA|nr:unnamed protein product [Pseudo-nitzschia multistriata]
MAEEAATPVAPPAPAPEEAPKEKKNDSKGKNRRKKEDDTPIEELFDLSKPIPRVDKPDKGAHEAKLKELNEKFEQLKKDKDQVQKKIEAAMTSGKNTDLGKARDAMAALRSKKGKMIEEKRAIRAQLDLLKKAGDKLVQDKKEARSSVRFNSIEEIDAEIKKLQKLQETTSMSLTEEKKLIKEMDGLQASKEKVKDVKSKDASLDGIKKERTAVNESIKAKDKEIDAVTKEMDEVGSKIKSLAAKETDKRSTLDALFKERDAFKKEISVVLKEKDALRDEYRENNNAWWNAQRAVKAQRQIQYEEEKKAREAEKAAYLKKKEEEEMKKIPYEEEMGLCDYLADYLSRTYLNAPPAENKISVKKEEVIAVKDDPFAGMVARCKKNDDEENYFSKGKGKKKRQRAPKKIATAPFTLSVDSFEQFGSIGLNPPTKLDEVENSVKELREKKVWYSQQPRGSVPTAKDIRKKNEKNAQKLRQTPSKAPTGKFSASDDTFVPLGNGSSTAAGIPSWGAGQKPAPTVSGEEVVNADDPTPADAAAQE